MEEINAVCSEIHTEHTKCGQNVEFLNISHGGRYSVFETERKVKAEQALRRNNDPSSAWCEPVAYRGGEFGVFKPPAPKFLSFDKVEPDCKLSGKC